jgi:conjugal transfer pilus assembly protein TraE
MKWTLYQSKLKRVLRHRNLFVRLAFAELSIIVLLIFGLLYAFTHQRIVITPPVVERSFWVGHNDVSAEYLAEMTNFFMGLRFNLSPANTAIQRDILLRYTDPRYYQSMKTLLVKEGDKISKDHISLSFYPVDVKVDPQTLTAQITGDLASTVGNTALPTERLTYQIHYTYHDGRLLVQSFEEIKSNG